MFSFSRFRYAPNFLMNPNPAVSIASTLPSRFGDSMLQNSAGNKNSNSSSSRSTSFSSAANKMMTSTGAGATTHGGQIDHLVIDASGLTSAALRLLKNEPQIERECSRIVLHNLSTLVKRLQPKKSLVVLMDGSEGVWKAAKTRGKGQSRKAEERAARGPGSGLALAVESALLDSLPDRKFVANCPQVVFSGSCSPGSVETKASLWAAGAVKRKSESQIYTWENHVEKMMRHVQNDNKNGGKNNKNTSPSSSIFLDPVFRGSENDRVAFVGPSEMYFHCLTSPFKRTMSISQAEKDYKSIESSGMLDWLTITGSMTRKIHVLPPNEMIENTNNNHGEEISSTNAQRRSGGLKNSSSLKNTNSSGGLSKLQEQQEKEREKELESLVLKRMGQEMAFLLLLAQGHGGYELNSCQQLSNLPDVINAYFAVVLDEFEPESGEQQQQLNNKNTKQQKNSISNSANINFVKNDLWLLERDFGLHEKNATLNSTSKFLNENLLQQQRTKNQKEGENNKNNNHSIINDPVDQLLPERFGLNLHVLRKILENCKAKLHPPFSGSAGSAVGTLAFSQMHQLAPDHPFSQKYSFTFSNRAMNAVARAAPSNHVRFADAAAYLDAVLQIFHLISKGEAPDPHFYLPGGFSPPAAWQLHELLVMLEARCSPLPPILNPREAGSEDDDRKIIHAMNESEKTAPLKDPDGNVLDKSKWGLLEYQKSSSYASSTSFPLTAAEYGLLAAGSAKHFSDMAKLYVGQQVSPKFAQKVAEETKSIPDALVQIRKLLKFSNPNNAQRALCISPAVCLVEVQGKSPEMERMLAKITRREELKAAKLKAEKDAEPSSSSKSTMNNNTSTTAPPSIPTGPVSLANIASANTNMNNLMSAAATSATLKNLKDQRSHWRMFPVELGS